MLADSSGTTPPAPRVIVMELGDGLTGGGAVFAVDGCAVTVGTGELAAPHPTATIVVRAIATNTFRDVIECSNLGSLGLS